MGHINYEFKARCADTSSLENMLKALSPQFKGEDRQTDTYFNVEKGRLKLRSGNIENALIYYERSNVARAKQSDVVLYRTNPGDGLLEILEKSLGIKVTVIKTRRIYYIENVKFHFDFVESLGSFVEVEAIDSTGTIGLKKLQEQCKIYADMFGINDQDYISHSYSDMLLTQGA